MNILWDFDGTLFDTYPAYANIFREELDGTASLEEITPLLKVSFTHAAGHYRLSGEQIKSIFARERALAPSETPPFPHVEKVLQFAEINVIMTHKPRKEVLGILNDYGWNRYFAEIVADGDGFPRKPDPSAYLYLHQKYRLDLVIGDREIDMVPAKILGIRTCLFQNAAPGADFYLSGYEDFFAVFKSTPHFNGNWSE